MAARIGWIGIGAGVDRVVVVLGVDRIDGDERELSPVLTPGEIGGAERRGTATASDDECGG